MKSTQSQGIVITQTPFRISFFGGGTDFPDYFNQQNTLVIGTTINKYIYVTLNSLERFFEKRIRLSYSKLENVEHPLHLEHPIVKCILNEHPLINENTFLDIHTYADLPASSGVGSSSAFTVGMLNALYLLNGIYKTPEMIAKEAIQLEREKLKEAGGWQDQIFSAFGGFNCIRFSGKGFTVEPICISQEKRNALEQSCMLFFTGITRSSSDIQNKVFGKSTHPDLSHIQKLSEQALHTLTQSTSPEEMLREFGKLLHESWMAKRHLSADISNNHIDEMYEKAMRAGAFGGKLCGAGGGGFLLFIVPAEKQSAVRDALSEHKLLQVNFEQQGSKVIYSKS